MEPYQERTAGTGGLGRGLNDGDWVESCTALVEHHDGRLELIGWVALNRLSFFQPNHGRIPESA